jgi:uncharacterized protein
MSDSTSTGTRPFALVTGASSGIGLSRAHQFAENGVDLVAAAEDDGIHPAADEIATHGAAVVAEQVDLSTPVGVEALHRAITQKGRTVSAAAINAGVGVGGPFAETDLDADLQLVGLDVRSTVHLAKLLVRDMSARGEGRLFERADMEDTKVGSGRKDDPEDVARDGFEALMAGKDHVVAGSARNKAQAAASAASPATARAKVQAAQTKPGSGG